MLEWQLGKVVSIIHETHNTKRFLIEVPSCDAFDFKPGQFVTLDLPIHEKKNKRWRSYSISSWPNLTNTFELIIVLVDGGAGSTHLLTQVEIGDEIPYRGPQGVFVLPAQLDSDLFLICTGTGIAPFRSMCHHILRHQIPHKNIYLIFGTRTQADLLYHQEFLDLEKQLEGFHYLPVLSREQWNGHTGYVHDVYKKFSEGKPDAQFMLCGWKMMIDDARKNLTDMGYDKKQIHFELYG